MKKTLLLQAGLIPLLIALASLVACGNARAGIAYGTVNNFDTVNATSNVCHGFEIELDDIRTTDITYTYDYNHYGTPRKPVFDALRLGRRIMSNLNWHKLGPAPAAILITCKPG